MNQESNEKLTFIGKSEENFSKMLEEYERNNSFEDQALEQFIKKPKKSNVLNNMVFILLFFLYCVICVIAIVSALEGTMKLYVAIPLIVLSIMRNIMAVKDAKKYKDENNKKYK